MSEDEVFKILAGPLQRWIRSHRGKECTDLTGLNGTVDDRIRIEQKIIQAFAAGYGEGLREPNRSARRKSRLLAQMVDAESRVNGPPASAEPIR